MDDSRKWWKARNSRGQVAHVPHTIVTPYQVGETSGDIFSNPLYAPPGRGAYTERHKGGLAHEQRGGGGAALPPAAQHFRGQANPTDFAHFADLRS